MSAPLKKTARAERTEHVQRITMTAFRAKSGAQAMDFAGADATQPRRRVTTMRRRDPFWYPGHGPAPARGSKSTTAAVPVYEKAEETMSEQQAQKPSDEIPRRIRIDKMTPAELAIHEAVLAVEAAGADTRLTDAVNLLQAARDKVADFVDGVDRPAPSTAPAQEPKRPVFVSISWGHVEALKQWRELDPAIVELVLSRLVSQSDDLSRLWRDAELQGLRALAKRYRENLLAFDNAVSLLNALSAGSAEAT